MPDAGFDPTSASSSVMRGFGRLHVVVVAVAAVVTLVDPIWLRTFHAAPPWIALLWLGAFIAVACGFRAARGGVLRNAAAALLFGGFAASVRAAALGDRLIWLILPRLEGDQAHAIYRSEGLGTALQHLSFSIAGVEGQRHLAPVLGVLACFAWLTAGDSLLGRGASAVARRVFAVAWLATPLPLVFAFDYIENTQAALPPLIAALPCLVRAGADDLDPARRRTAAIGAGLWLGLAAATHGFALFVAPALPIAIACARGRTRLGSLAAGLAAFAAAVVAAFAVAAACGGRIVAGHAAGGDGHLFVPWSLEGAPPSVRAAFFTWAHFRESAHLVAFAAPLAVTALPFALREGPASRVLSLAALGHAGFVALVNFDLGFPPDFDLMLGLGVVAQAGAALLVARHAATGGSGKSGARTAAAALLVAAIPSWMLAGAFLSSRFETPSQRNTPGATLSVDGRDGSDAPGAIRIEVDRAAPRAELKIQGPPRARVVIMTGPESPFPIRLRSFGREALDGYLHVGYGAAFEEDWIRKTPVALDDEGRFTYRWAGTPAASGPILAVQALVFPPPGAVGDPRLTAAFVLVAR
jgi:hypothetical protein